MTRRSGSIAAALHERELWLLVAVVVLLLNRSLFFDTYIFRDLYQFFLPKKLFLAESLRAGRFPLWDPLTHGGMPFLVPSNSPFHPSTLLYVVFPTLFAFNFDLVLHHVLAAVAAYVLGRTLSFSRPASFLCGTAFALSGYALSTANLTPLLKALPWFPIALLVWSRYLERRRPAYLAATAISIALPLLGAAVEATALLGGMLFVWTLVSPAAEERRTRHVAALGFAGAFAIALAAIQVVPAYDMVRESSRRKGRSWSSFTQWSVHPKRLAELAVPGLLGPVRSLADADYLGRGLEDDGFPYMLSIYLGAPVLVVAAFGGLVRDGVLSRATRRGLLALALLGIVFALGRYLPGFRLVWHVPLVANFRYPVKALVLGLLPIALLAGAGLDSASEGRERALSRLLALAGVLVAAPAVAVIVGSFLNADLPAAYFGVPVSVASRTRLLGDLARSAGALLAGAVVLAGGKGAGPGLLVAVAAVDLLLAGTAVNAFAPRELIEEPPLAREARRVMSGARLFRDSDPTTAVISAPANDIIWLVRGNLEGLKFYTASLYGLPVVFHTDYDGLAPARIAWLTERLLELPWEKRLPILAAADVRAVISAQRLTLPGLRPVASFRAPHYHLPLHLYELSAARPVRFAADADVEYAADAESALAKLAARPLGAPGVVLLATAPDPEHAGTSTACGPATITLLERRAGSTKVEVETSCPGFLVLADPTYPGWVSTLDGRTVETATADVAFSAVKIPRGRHVVTRRYAPRSLILGAAVSLAAFFGLFLFRPRKERPVVSDRQVGGCGT